MKWGEIFIMQLPSLGTIRITRLAQGLGCHKLLEGRLLKLARQAMQPKLKT
jgi:hypothetical protein